MSLKWLFQSGSRTLHDRACDFLAGRTAAEIAQAWRVIEQCLGNNDAFSVTEALVPFVEGWGGHRQRRHAPGEISTDEYEERLACYWRTEGSSSALEAANSVSYRGVPHCAPVIRLQSCYSATR